MPREGESDNSSAGIQSPEPITEGSVGSELVSELKDAPNVLSAEPICSKCGGSKESRDRDIKPSALTRSICNCRLKPEKIPSEGESENSSAGIQSPEPITESSLGSEPVSELKDVSNAMSLESTCSKCGGSKQSRDVKPKALTQLICNCKSKPEEILRESESDNSSAGIQSPEPITEGSLSPEPVSELKDVSDAMSAESICSRCGGSKQSRDRGIKPLAPIRFICNCTSKSDEIQQEENISLQDCPETDAAVQEIVQIQESGAGEISPSESTEPSQGEPHVREHEAQQEPTTGCVDDIRDWIIDDEILDCNWYKFTCFLATFIIILIAIGITVKLVYEQDTSTPNSTNSSSTNFTVDEM